MGPYLRRSPVKFPSPPSRKEMRNGWEVVLEYRDQGDAPFLIDLSHISKWDAQDNDLSRISPLGSTIPEIPGNSRLQNEILISRMNPTQASIWHLLRVNPPMHQEPAYTDVTDAYAILALMGKDVSSIMEKVTRLDLSSPAKKPPFLLQGPVLHVRCQIVVLGPKGDDAAVLIACSRGYGQSMSEALLDAGKEWGLGPAGETAFRDWLKEGCV